MRLDVLIDRLEKHGKIRSSMEETNNLPVDELIELLVKEFEQMVERYKSLSTFAGHTRRIKAEKLSEQSSPSTQFRAVSDEKSPQAIALQHNNPLSVLPIKIGLPSIDLQQIEKGLAAQRAADENEKRRLQELDAADYLIRAEINKDWVGRVAENEGKVFELMAATQKLSVQPNLEPVRTDPEVPLKASPDLSNDDLLFVHAVSLSPLESVEGQVKILETLRGIDGIGSLCAFRSQGLSLFVSKVKHDEFTVTKAGMLLLNKEDGLYLRTMNEQILNELRISEPILPVVFGTVVRGKRQLSESIDRTHEHLKHVLEKEDKTLLWAVKVLVPEVRVRQMSSVGGPANSYGKRSREAKTGSSRSDIKALEKQLQLEKHLAEVIHEGLAGGCTSTSVHSMVSLGDGMAEEYKLILHASYEFPLISRRTFFLNVLYLQEEHRKMGLLFEVHGGAERITLRGDAVASHSASD